MLSIDRTTMCPMNHYSGEADVPRLTSQFKHWEPSHSTISVIFIPSPNDAFLWPTRSEGLTSPFETWLCSNIPLAIRVAVSIIWQRDFERVCGVNRCSGGILFGNVCLATYRALDHCVHKTEGVLRISQHFLPRNMRMASCSSHQSQGRPVLCRDFASCVCI